MEAGLLEGEEGGPEPNREGAEGNSAELLNFCSGRTSNPHHAILFITVLYSPLTCSDEDRIP